MVVVVASIYIKRVRRARARAYIPHPGMVVKSNHIKGQKKTLEHSPTLTTAHRRRGNQMISNTP